MIKQKFLTALLTLLTISAGTWAQEETLLVTINASNDFTYGSKTFEDAVTATFSKQVGKNTNGWYPQDDSEVTLTIAAANDDVTITRVKFYTTLGDAEDTTAPFETGMINEFVQAAGTQRWHVKVNGSTVGDATKNNVLTKIEVYGYVPLATLSADGKTATMTMPASDVTVTYDLVRDLSQSSPTFGGLPAGDQAIVKKDGDNYAFKDGAPAITLNDPLADNADIITSEDINVEVNKYGASMTFEKTIALADFLANPEPGTYEIIVRGTDNGSYDGWVGTPYFTLTEQYDLALQPADAFSAGKLSEVTVGGTAVTLGADGTATTTAQPAQPVILKAKRGYVIEKVEAKKNVPVTSIRINQGNFTTVSPGQTLTLSATITPDDASDKTVTWTVSGDPTSFDPQQDGTCRIMFGEPAGSATVTVTANDGSGVSASITVECVMDGV